MPAQSYRQQAENAELNLIAQAGERLASDIMNAPKHTPGPWEFTQYNTPNGASYQIERLVENSDPDEPTIVNIAECCEFTDGQDLANARLIAAAPDLLAACEAAQAILVDGHEIVWQQLTAAIAKAVGQS